MKKFIAGVITGIVLVSFITIYAEKADIFFPGIKIFIDGELKEPEDVQPFIYMDRTFVPLRFISENFGAKVGWEGETKTVIINTKEYGEMLPTATPGPLPVETTYKGVNAIEHEGKTWIEMFDFFSEKYVNEYDIFYNYDLKEVVITEKDQPKENSILEFDINDETTFYYKSPDGAVFKTYFSLETIQSLF